MARKMDWNIDENKPAAVVPVVGENQKNGFTINDVPDGFITWEEQWEAWFAYHEAYPTGRPCEEIANGGGFTFSELKQWLGHTPKTWVPRDFTKYKSFWEDFYNPDEPLVEDEVAPEQEVKLSHLWYGNGDSICVAETDAPTTPFNFDVIDGPSCQLCLDKVLGWLRDWNKVDDVVDG